MKELPWRRLVDCGVRTRRHTEDLHEQIRGLNFMFDHIIFLSSLYFLNITTKYYVECCNFIQ